jgi:dipeptidyl aminopeptidase/acylaminoacyl peptidase
MPEFQLPPEAAAALGPDALVPPLEFLLEGVDATTRVAVSPVAHVRAGAPPFLLVHGTADAVVPFAQSETLAEALLAVGADVRLKPVPGAGHGFDGYPDVGGIVGLSVEFLIDALSFMPRRSHVDR